jgi:hypothetical protein
VLFRSVFAPITVLISEAFVVPTNDLDSKFGKVVVPKKEARSGYSEELKVPPLHKSHPGGAVSPAKIITNPTCGKTPRP